MLPSFRFYSSPCSPARRSTAQAREIKELEASANRAQSDARDLQRARRELGALHVKNRELQHECARLLDMLEPLLVVQMCAQQRPSQR